jgi:hypothetical protein
MIEITKLRKNGKKKKHTIIPNNTNSVTTQEKIQVHYNKLPFLLCNADGQITTQSWFDNLQNQYEPSEYDIKNEYMPFHISRIQLYNPIYSRFFTMNANNYSTFSLNHEYIIKDLKTIYELETKQTHNKDVFIKFSPLLDPIRYMTGKYSIENDILRNLPNYESTEKECHKKLISFHNASYTDCFFSFLIDRVKSKHNFIHGMNFYGSFLGLQEKFKMDITDDYDFLRDSDFFQSNKNNYFSIANYGDVDNYSLYGQDKYSRSNKRKITIEHTIEIEPDIIENILPFDEEISTNITTNDRSLEVVFEKSSQPKNDNKSSISDSDSDDSSVITVNDDTEENRDNDENDDDYETVDDDEDNADEFENTKKIYAYINNFPIQMICMEKCIGTMDDLFEKQEINDENGIGFLFQIIMILLTYQKLFSFTHNDLHTNNIMYSNTDVEFLYYQFNNIVYKVPTFGKIFKLIDFGRSIYFFQGKTFCSDSFDIGGDAYSQYNFPPFFNNKKKMIQPNPSFDLCRLGCSIFDFIIDIDNLPEQYSPLQKLVSEWTSDDTNKNILYTKSGNARYKDFKLYKMIARTVHKHTPENQLKRPIFKQYISDCDESNNFSVFNIDTLPVYTEQ